MSTFGLEHLISQVVEAGIIAQLEQRAAGFRPEIGEDVLELRPVNLVAWAGLLYLLLGVGFVVQSINEVELSMRVLFIVLGCAFLPIGSFLIGYRKRHRIYFNALSIYVVPVIGDIRTYSQSDIISCKEAVRSHVLTTSSGKKIKVSKYLIGAPALIRTVQLRLK